MKFLILTIALFTLFPNYANSQTFYGSTDVKIFREGRNKEFRNKDESPLKDEDFADFKGLNYFDEDAKFKVEAKFTRTSDEKHFQMPTSSGTSKKFVKYGILEFQLNGENHTLSIYQADAELLKKFPEYADLFFVPFKDSTNGKETYGGGRYIDLRLPAKGDKVILNFNNAYNPNCAYGSDRYNCPIPPKENFLKVDIKAGEKKLNDVSK